MSGTERRANQETVETLANRAGSVPPSLKRGNHMMRLNMLRQPGCWTRIVWRARLAHSMTNDAKAVALRAAVLAMNAEQRAEGIAAGVVMCEFDGCACAATHCWTRTTADLKAMRRKHKGTWLTGEPKSIRCETHIPDWLAPKYARLVQGANVLTVAA